MNQIDNAEKTLKLIAANPARVARPGGLVATWRFYRGRRLGPYYCRRKSIYLGGEGPGVETVRQALANLQRLRQERQSLQHLRRQALASLRIQKRSLQEEANRLGLRLQGCEVRGRQTSGLLFPTRDGCRGEGGKLENDGFGCQKEPIGDGSQSLTRSTPGRRSVMPTPNP
jgi:hypothetical protein